MKPRGPPKGFFNREKFKKFSTNTVRSDTSDPKVGFSPAKLQFGFSPLPQSKSVSVKPPDNQDSEIYFNANIDTLQAPGDKKYYKRADKRSPKYFPNLPRIVTNSVKKQDRKSNLDFLGIFDTRKYFFIPPNRRI